MSTEACLKKKSHWKWNEITENETAAYFAVIWGRFSKRISNRLIFVKQNTILTRMNNKSGFLIKGNCVWFSDVFSSHFIFLIWDVTVPYTRARHLNRIIVVNRCECNMIICLYQPHDRLVTCPGCNPPFATWQLAEAPAALNWITQRKWMESSQNIFF